MATPTLPLLLRAPPFPGCKPITLAKRNQHGLAEDPTTVFELLRAARVGGTFWAAQPEIPSGTVVACPWDVASAEQMVQRAADTPAPVLFWIADTTLARAIGAMENLVVTGPCDPWHIAVQAVSLWGHSSDERLLIATLAGISVVAMDDAPMSMIAAMVTQGIAYVDPFTGEATTAAQTIALLAFWRSLIDANRPIVAAAGIAFWKRETVAPLLWGGGEPLKHLSSRTAVEALPRKASVAIWKSKTAPDVLAAIEARNTPLYEVEDGFIRSIGLGADCVPPLSLAVDALGPHFDPAQPSTLENILNAGTFDSEILARAIKIREMIVASGLSKYGVSGDTLARPGGDRRHVLVTGQVEDDRSVLCARGEVTGNLDLLRRARAAEPGAYLIYRPHPDVDAGHRAGHILDAIVLTHADAIDRGTPISALLDMVDGVHVLSSLAGFEALLRGRDVTTHGVPFYAGWGLTHDLGPVPARRRAKLNVNQLAAGVLLLYPRYLDPITSLPCPPEILVHRLIAGEKRESRFIVPLRRLQGKVNRWRFRAGFVEKV